MEPYGIPLRPMDELFHLFDSKVTLEFGLKSANERTLLAMPEVVGPEIQGGDVKIALILNLHNF